LERQQIEAEAARLLARLNLDIDPAETAEIYAWVAQDPRHAVAFARAEASWDSAERLKAFPPAEIPPAAEEPEAPAPSSRNWIRWRWVAAIAASLLIAMSSAVYYYMPTTRDYRTAVGETRDIALPDGSAMHLNSGSSATIHFTRQRRYVRILTGEASFNVAHDTARPFDVAANSAVIRAVGTAFNVRLRESLVELTVTEGTVAVRAGKGQTERVRAGNGAAIRPRTLALTQLEPSLIERRMAWRENMVELDGDTVEQAVAEFNRYRKAPLVICDARVSGLRIGGRFRTTDSDEFLTALQMTLPVRAVRGDDGSVMLLYREESEATAPDPTTV
jgi:transmembrane sensor